MFSKTPTGKASKGSVQIVTSHNRLQLRFRFGGKQHYLSIGLPDTQVNRKLAEAKARQIELDLLSGNFDETLAKYKPQSVLSSLTPDITPKAAITLPELWAKYVEYKTPNASPKTINGTYEPVLAHLKKCSTDGLEDVLKFRMELLQATTQSQARRTLMQLSAACKWGIKHGLITSNPLDGMYKELEATRPVPPMAFTVEERDRIIEAFKNDSRKGINYRHYAPFVEFLFLTGCRPSEAIGLRWINVTPDCGRIHFCESIVEISGKLERRTETKTGIRRWFTCGERLQALLQSIKPEMITDQSLVFPSPKGKAIGLSNFNDRYYK